MGDSVWGGAYGFSEVLSRADRSGDASLYGFADALAVAVCFAAVAVRTGSLLAGILVHFLTNITAPGSSGAWLWCCVLIYGIYGLALCINISKEIPGETDTPGPTQFF